MNKTFTLSIRVPPELSDLSLEEFLDFLIESGVLDALIMLEMRAGNGDFWLHGTPPPFEPEPLGPLDIAFFIRRESAADDPFFTAAFHKARLGPPSERYLVGHDLY